MSLTTIAADVPMPILLLGAAIVAVIVLLSRTLLTALLLGLIAAVLWQFDWTPHIAKVREMAETHVSLPLGHLHLAQFGVGLVCGLIVFSTLFFVRAVTQAALVAGSASIIYVIATDGVPSLMQHTASALQIMKEFDSFTKGVALAKFVSGFFKVRQIRRDRKIQAQ